MHSETTVPAEIRVLPHGASERLEVLREKDLICDVKATAFCEIRFQSLKHQGSRWRTSFVRQRLPCVSAQ